jgi:adenylate kinase
MIIAISGSVGTGKTTIAKEVAKKMNMEIIHLNDWALDFKIKEVKELQTFDFNLDGLIHKINQHISNNLNKNIILEGHFAHYINPELVDLLFVINRDLNFLKEEYQKRGYNEQKIEDNLEVESFNLCFYEGLEEGYEEEKQIFCVDNNSNLDKIVNEIDSVINDYK